MQCKIVKREICKRKDTCYLRDSFPPSWLTDRAPGNTIVPVESLSFFILLSKHFHGFMICLLQRAVSCGVFNVLVECSVDLLCPFIDVANPNVEVVKPLSVVMITSS